MSAVAQQPAAVEDIDACVRKVTAASSFDDLKNTLPSYAPSFYPGRSSTREDVATMHRVAAAWNAWAARVGRRQCVVHEVK